MNDKKKKVDKKKAHPDLNRDPISGAPGAHPLGVGLGTTGGATLGAVAGSFAGPVGTAVGSVIGGIAGGLTGKGVAEGVNPTVEDKYWRANYATRPYVKKGAKYTEYEPAYRFGWEGRGRYSKLNWDKAEPHLSADWRKASDSLGGWDQARPAVRDAWDRFPNEDGLGASM